VQRALHVQVTLYLTCIDLPEGEFAVYVSTFPNYAVNWHKVVVARQNCKCAVD